MATDKVTEIVAENAGSLTDDAVIDKVDDEVNDQQPQTDLVTKLINSTGNHLAQWDAEKFSKIIVDRAENAFKSKKDAFGLVLSALITLGSAGLNMWYLMDTAIGLRRDKHEDYNLTEWIVVMFEVIFVYGGFAGALACFVMLIFNIAPVGCLAGLNISLKFVGNFSAFQYIKLLAIHNLKKQAFAIYASFKGWLSMTQLVLKLTGHERDSDDDFDDMGTCEKICVYICVIVCCLPCILCVLACACSCASILVVPSLGLLLLNYALGPAALLLKIRQVSFVMEKHVLDWPLHHYFSFFGFINNIAGLSANEDVQLSSFIKVLFMGRQGAKVSSDEPEVRETFDDDEQRAESPKSVADAALDQVSESPEINKALANARDEAAKKLFGAMLVQALVEKGEMSYFKVWLILNSWSMDPDQFIELFKEPPAPSKAAKSGSGSMEEQMAAHIDHLAKSDVAGRSTENVDGVRKSEDMV